MDSGNNSNEKITTVSTTSTPCGSPVTSATVNGGSPLHHRAAPPVVMSPCAACKILRRRCADKCVLAPYFPPTDPIKFTIAHKVFGASNIIKLLQDLPEIQREDAVSSMVYEANARLRDPVYGCAGSICQLQKQISDLQAELAKARAEIMKMQCQESNLLALICMEMTQSQQLLPSSPHDTFSNFFNFYDENNNLNSIWDQSLWT